MSGLMSKQLMSKLKKTPLYNEHLRLGAKLVEFNGWEMPVYYSSLIEEHINVRERAGIFDICHMGELFIEGKDSFRLVQRLITNDLSRLEDGKAFYSCICLENGGVIDDLFVYKFSSDKFMLVVNAANVKKDFEWLLGHKGMFDCTITDRTEAIAKIDIQGPKAEDILSKSTPLNLSTLKRFHFAEDCLFLSDATQDANQANADANQANADANQANADANQAHTNHAHTKIPALISRTGYTAEDGFELYFDSKRAVEVWNRLLKDGEESGLKPIGLGARDTLRIEACYSLYGHEISEEINPFEAGIGFTVKFDKGDFIGKKALLNAKDNLKRKVVAFEMLDRAVARQGYEVLKDSGKIGLVTSGTFSPTFKKPLGMALIDINESNTGNGIEVKIRDTMYEAKVVERPFYRFRAADV